MTGTVTRVFLTRGFGFIVGDDELEYFLHCDDLARGEVWDGRWWRLGVRVEFEVKKLPDGRLRAVGTRLVR